MTCERWERAHDDVETSSRRPGPSELRPRAMARVLISPVFDLGESAGRASLDESVRRSSELSSEVQASATAGETPAE